jgi:YHS domain-containing protein
MRGRWTEAGGVISMGVMTRITDSLDNGRVSFGDREEIELATATDPVCGRELKRADAAAAVDHHGTVYFFCSTDCRDRFAARPDAYVSTLASASP